MSRIQLALNVDNLEASINFYRRLLATEPAKVRPGYANFAVAAPPPKLVLIENPGHGGSLNHLGAGSTMSTLSMPSRTAWPRMASPPSMSAAPHAATPNRTSSGSRAPRTTSDGRSTRSWPTVPSRADWPRAATAAAAPRQPPQKPR